MTVGVGVLLLVLSLLMKAVVDVPWLVSVDDVEPSVLTIGVLEDIP